MNVTLPERLLGVVGCKLRGAVAQCCLRAAGRAHVRSLAPRQAQPAGAS